MRRNEPLRTLGTRVRKAEMPDPAEIRALCLEIQESWSAREKQSRAGAMDGRNRRWTVPEVHCVVE
jgi:hypothetical protein